MSTVNPIFIIAILIALTIHEASHAVVANLLGDPTAKNEGRISLNPLKHLDLWGSLLFLFVGIGWGKPVPVNPHYFKNPKRDSALTSLAGPLSNFLMAVLLAIPIKFMPPNLFTTILATTFEVNILLCAFNLLPLPPLDGSKIFALLIPTRIYNKYSYFLETHLAYIIIFFLADLYIFPKIIGFSIFSTIVGFLTGTLKTIIFLGT